VNNEALDGGASLLPAFRREKIAKGREVFPLLTKGDEGGLDGLFQRAKVLSKRKFRQNRKKCSPLYRLLLTETFSN